MVNKSDAVELALEESRRALTYQAGTVDELRSRTGLLLAAGSVTASFLSAGAADQHELGVLGGVALVAFGVAVWLCLSILRPREWTFVSSATTLLEDWVDVDRDPLEMKRFLATTLEGHYDSNRHQLDRLLETFRFAAFAVGAEVILGSVQLATGL